MVSQAILFDGTTDYMTRGAALDGVVDSKVGIFSCWIRIDGKDSASRNFFITASEKVRLRFQNLNKLQFLFRNGNPGVVYRTSITLTTDPDYFHALSSWDAANDIVQLYVNDVDRTDQELPDPTVDANIDYTIGNWAVGADFTGTFKFEGAIFDFYFQPGEFLDFSIESNRRKFISEAGNPVDLGATGQLPTGTSAAVYLPGDQTNQALNAGTGGDFASQGTQVPGETPGPAAQAATTMAGVGGFQAAGIIAITSGTLAGVGGFQATAESTSPQPPQAISDFLEEALLNDVFNGLAVGALATHLALFTDATNDSSGGTEVTGNNYSRFLVNPNSGASPKWNLAVTDGAAFLVDNLDSILFPVATGGAWGTITHVALHDASVAGNRLWHGELEAPIDVNEGSSFGLPAGDLNLRVQ